MRMDEAMGQHRRDVVLMRDRSVLEITNSCAGGDRSRHELRQAACSGDPAKMYAFALTCDNPTEKEYWLRESAYEDYVPAMFDLACVCDDASRRPVWLSEAAGNGGQEAVLELADGGC